MASASASAIESVSPSRSPSPGHVVAFESMPHVELLLMAEEVEEGRRLAVGSMAVVSPPWTTATSQRGEMPVQAVDERTDLEAVEPRDRAGSMRGPVTAIILSRDGLAGPGNAEVTRRRRCVPTPDPPTMTMQTIVVGESSSARSLAFDDIDGLEASQVARKFEMLFGPGPDRSETGAEVVHHDVVGFINEQCRPQMGYRSMWSIISAL
jgi:hypothetical protein